MLHLKVLPLVQRVRRCVKFRVETSLQENHLCNAPPPSRVEEKRWGPKNTFPETNKQLAIVSTVSTWKLMIFGVHMKFPLVLTIIRQFSTSYRFDERLDHLQVIFWIRCAIRSLRSIGMVRLLHTQGAGKPFWNDALNVPGSTSCLDGFWKGMRDDENWWKLGNCLKIVFLDDVVEKVVLLCWVKGWSLTSC